MNDLWNFAVGRLRDGQIAHSIFYVGKVDGPARNVGLVLRCMNGVEEARHPKMNLAPQWQL